MNITVLIDKAINIPGQPKAISLAGHIFTEETSPAVLISEDLLRPIKIYVRTNNSLAVCEDIIRYILQCFKSKRNKNCCLKLLHLLDVLFTRSRFCREAIVSSLSQLHEVCGLEFKEHHKVITGTGNKRQKISQSKDEIAEHIKTKCLTLLNGWDQVYGMYYPTLHVISRYMAEKGHRDLRQEQETVVQQKREKKQRALNLLRLRARQVLEEVTGSLPDIVENIRSLDTLFQMLYPSPDELFPALPAPTLGLMTTGNSAASGNAVSSSTDGDIGSGSIHFVHAEDDDDDDDELYSHIQWEDGNDKDEERGAIGAASSSSVAMSKQQHVPVVLPAHAAVGSTRVGDIDFGSFGSRYYSLEISIPIGLPGTCTKPRDTADCTCPDPESETFRTIVPMVTELAAYLKKYAAAKLDDWKVVLQLYIKYCCSEVNDVVDNAQASLPTRDEVNAVLVRLTETKDRLNNIIDNKVQTLIGNSSSCTH